MPTTKSKESADLIKLTLVQSDIPSPAELTALSKLYKEVLRKTVNRLKKLDSKYVDEAVLKMHEEAFDLFDCLSCGNCCKSISPAINNLDIDQIAKSLRVKPSEVVVKYLQQDDEGDFVFRSQPCPFIDSENYCSVYNHRPKACREYPHTNRRRFHQILNLSLLNAEICPIVYAILKKLA